jgi:hypothetical protein
MIYCAPCFKDHVAKCKASRKLFFFYKYETRDLEHLLRRLDWRMNAKNISKDHPMALIQKELMKDTKDYMDIQQKSLVKVVRELKYNEYSQIYYVPQDINKISKSLVTLVDEELGGNPRLADLKDNNGYVDWDEIFAEPQFTPAYQVGEKAAQNNISSDDIYLPSNQEIYEIVSLNKPMSVTSRVTGIRFKQQNNLPGIPLNFINLEETPKSPKCNEEHNTSILNESFTAENFESLRRDLKASSSFNIINIYNNINPSVDPESEAQDIKILNEVRKKFKISSKKQRSF